MNRTTATAERPMPERPSMVEFRRPKVPVSSGLRLGTVLAVAISWDRWHSILWAILHGICSWFYVIYFWWTRA